MGSGFVVKSGVVATNLHVFEGASRDTQSSRPQGQVQHQGTVAIDLAHDIALVAVDDIKAPSLVLGDSKHVAVGDEVYVAGNPRGLENLLRRNYQQHLVRSTTNSLLQITAPISPGSSGGPVVNSKAEVVGIAFASFKGGQNLNFAIPSAYVSSLIPVLAAQSSGTISWADESAKDQLDSGRYWLARTPTHYSVTVFCGRIVRICPGEQVRFLSHCNSRMQCRRFGFAVYNRTIGCYPRDRRGV